MEVDNSLLFKFFAKETDAEEVAAIAAWIKDNDAHKEEFKRAYKVFFVSHCALSGKTAEQIRAKYKTRKPRAKVFRIINWSVAGAAAVVLGVLLSGHIRMERQIGNTRLTAHARHGQQITQTLSDGTVVELNSGSTIEFPAVFLDGERRVRLSGEAIFKVQHDDAHPFIVETFAYDVKVLGTEFDVVADERSDVFSTMLIQGSVAVLDKNGEEMVCLSPNQKASKSGNGLVTKTVADVYEEILWQEDKISMANASFEEVMRRFERGFGVRIIIDRTDMPDMVYSYGKVRISDGIVPALDRIQRMVDFTYAYDTTDGAYHIR